MARVTTRKKIEDEQASTFSDVKLYARKIWLAGLGAYAKVNEEGTQYVKELIKTGEQAEQEAKKVLDEKLEAANSEWTRSRAKSPMPRGASKRNSTESKVLSTAASQRP